MRTLACDWPEKTAEPTAFPNLIYNNNSNWTEETEEIEETDELDEIEETDDVGGEWWGDIESAIEASALPSSGTSNRFLFSLARRVKGVEQKYGLKFSPILLRSLFDRWENFNRRYLRPNHDYFTEFLVKLATVRQPHGSTLASALEVAHSQPPPKRALGIKDTDAHVVASLCRELQRVAGREPFFLIGRACADLLGRSHSTVSYWLKAFQPLGILRLKEKGRQGRGSRYRYIAED